MATPPKKRFKIMSNAELKQKQEELKNPNTAKSDKRADTAFKAYLRETGAPTDNYLTFDQTQMEEWLSKFWFGARTCDQNNPELYRVNSLKGFKYGLKRIINNELGYDITKLSSFSKCMDNFELACKELKKEGKGFVKSYDEMEDEDRILLYNSQYLDPDGDRVTLQNKVLFDILYYFCRRGKENLELMHRNWFEVRHDAKTNHDYVVKVRDEHTKNHQEVDQPLNNNCMTENKGDRQCPVRSFKMYMSHLHPENEYLWQKPNVKPKLPNSTVWYTRSHLGKTPLGSFVSDLCKKVKTSKPYTNHCVRVSTTNIVTDTGLFNDKEVMDFTGHKCPTSLQRYRRVKQAKKIQMGKILNSAITKTHEELMVEIQAEQETPKEQAKPSTSAATPKTPALPAQETPETPEVAENKMAPIIPFEPNWDEDVQEFDLLDILTQIEEANKPQPMPVEVPKQNPAVTTVSQNMFTQQQNSPMFAGCKIGNITINITKK